MKTVPTQASVKTFIENVKNRRRRQDAETVLQIMRKATGKKAVMWGPSIIGFDTHHYKYADGSAGKICTVGFSPRSNALAFYLTTKFKGGDALLKKLGKHKFGAGGCLYINKLADVDLDVLADLIEKSYQHKKANQSNNHGCE